MKLYDEIRKGYLVTTGEKPDADATIENIIAHAGDIAIQVMNAAAGEKAELISSLMCTNHNDKMAGFVSLSTCCKTNEFCKARAKVEGSICSKCYAMSQLTRYANQAIKQAIAGVVLQSVAFTVDEMPFINAAFFRFEAFGDIANGVQLHNYVTIAKANPHCNFALWSKNHGILAGYFENHEKPGNLITIYSPMFINQPEEELFNELYAKGVYDRMFTVWADEKTANQHGYAINCGARSCASCRKCYTSGNGVTHLNELLK